MDPDSDMEYVFLMVLNDFYLLCKIWTGITSTA